MSSKGPAAPGIFAASPRSFSSCSRWSVPDLAIFGQKDYQQQLVIRRMVEDLHVPVELAVVPTVREPDGLALSSRNRYLNPQERQAARVLYRALERAVAGRRRAGNDAAERVRQILRETLESEPLVRLDYAEVADAETLEPLGDLSKERTAVALLAARIGTTRLIDNACCPWRDRCPS